MAAQLSEEQIRHILQGIRIPPQPQILVDLQMEQVMPDPDFRQITKLISQDVGLAGTILKFVNSPFFGLSNKITSIEQAVSLLGMDSVINIVNGIAIKGEMSDERIVALTRFWDTANDIALISATISKKIGYRAPDEAYALGLFHNSGIPLMMVRFPDYMEVVKEAYADPVRRITEVENEKFNTNHAVIGYYTARSWNLPAKICEAIAEHHSVGRLFEVKDGKNAEKKTLLSILKIAEHVCGNYRIIGGHDEDYEWERLEKDVLEYVGLTNYDIEDMMENFNEMGVSINNYR